MKKQFTQYIILAFSLCLFFFSSLTLAGSAPEQSLAPVLQKILPAVVNVRAIIKVTDIRQLERMRQESDSQDQKKLIPDKMLSVASGVIVDAEKGYILTNAHVIEDAQSVTITLSDGRHYKAKIIGSDKPSDIALLQIQAKNLIAIPLGNSDTLKVGDRVIAIGNPFGLNQTVTSGIVSALGRTTLGIESYENFIQTDASINPGNSGGALTDIHGALIGINTAILAPDRGNIGIGFAIPVDMANSVMQQLIHFGNVRRGALGVGAQDLTPDLVSAFQTSAKEGAVVTEVMPSSPAETAGLAVNDIITAVNGAPIKNANDLINAIAFLRVDSKASIQLLRHNKSMTLTPTITDPQKRADDRAKKNPFFHGVTLKHFTLQSSIHGNIEGVMVVDVEEDSNAWQADLHEGDVIVAANQQPTKTIDDLQKIAANTKDNLLLNVLRGPGAIFLIISKEAE